MAEICTSIVSPRHGNLKPSSRYGKDWGSPPFHTMGQYQSGCNPVIAVNTMADMSKQLDDHNTPMVVYTERCFSMD